MIKLNDKVIEKHFKTKKYLHFDKRINFTSVSDYITDTSKIAVHSFLPLIHYIDETVKYVGEQNDKLDKRPIKIKKRDIKYAGHLDGYIYKYYAMMLNEKYNVVTKKKGIDKCSLAYRNNKKNESNITFAAEVINSIVDYKESYILVGDFTHFFDEIDHALLKRNLLITFQTDRLPSDWYNVYRSLTRYGYYEKELINEHCGKDKILRQEKRNSYFHKVKDFRKFQKNIKAQSNKTQKGIPQGTALSGVLANIMAIDFDVKLNEIAKKHLGLYKRYSDDFILVIPKHQLLESIDFNYFHKLIEDIKQTTEKNCISLQEDKTDILFYKSGEIINSSKKRAHLDYLGFIFNGKEVNMRSKSTYKFYRQAYNLIENAKKVKVKKGLKRIPYRRKLYRLYTDLGADIKPHGNFITYAQNSQDIFDKLSPKTKNMMLNQIKNRKRKIEQKLGVKIHT